VGNFSKNRGLEPSWDIRSSANVLNFPYLQIQTPIFAFY
jgi:hypothetical protein